MDYMQCTYDYLNTVKSRLDKLRRVQSACLRNTTKEFGSYNDSKYTEQGMCCTFNINAADEIFHGKTFARKDFLNIINKCLKFKIMIEISKLHYYFYSCFVLL
jgi:hypothetical protein